MDCGYKNLGAEGCGYLDVVNCAVLVGEGPVDEDVADVARSVGKLGGGESGSSSPSKTAEAEQEDIAGTAALVYSGGGTSS
jgi:uncharacterized membrane protein